MFDNDGPMAKVAWVIEDFALLLKMRPNGLVGSQQGSWQQSTSVASTIDCEPTLYQEIVGTSSRSRRFEAIETLQTPFAVAMACRIATKPCSNWRILATLDKLGRLPSQEAITCRQYATCFPFVAYLPLVPHFAQRVQLLEECIMWGGHPLCES